MLDVKVIPNEECATQDKLIAYDATIVKRSAFVPKRHVWKLQQADLYDSFVKFSQVK